MQARRFPLFLLVFSVVAFALPELIGDEPAKPIGVGKLMKVQGRDDGV